MNRISKALAIGVLALQTSCAGFFGIVDEQKVKYDKGQLLYLKQEDPIIYNQLTSFIDSLNDNVQSVTYLRRTVRDGNEFMTEHIVYGMVRGALGQKFFREAIIREYPNPERNTMRFTREGELFAWNGKVGEINSTLSIWKQNGGYMASEECEYTDNPLGIACRVPERYTHDNAAIKIHYKKETVQLLESLLRNSDIDSIRTH